MTGDSPLFQRPPSGNLLPGRFTGDVPGTGYLVMFLDLFSREPAILLDFYLMVMKSYLLLPSSTLTICYGMDEQFFFKKSRTKAEQPGSE